MTTQQPLLALPAPSYPMARLNSDIKKAMYLGQGWVAVKVGAIRIGTLGNNSMTIQAVSEGVSARWENGTERCYPVNLAPLDLFYLVDGIRTAYRRGFTVQRVVETRCDAPMHKYPVADGWFIERAARVPGSNFYDFHLCRVV